MLTINEEIALDKNYNIIDVLNIDHLYLNECINVLVFEDVNKFQKLFYARRFLETLKKHLKAKEKTVYDSLIETEGLQGLIIERSAESSMAKNLIESLFLKIKKADTLDLTLESELKVLASLIERHIYAEKNNLFPKLALLIDSGILNEIGFQFMILRKFTSHDLDSYPELKHRIYQENSNKKKWSSFFVKKVNLYITALLASPQVMKEKYNL